MYHYSYPTSPRNRPTKICRYGLGAVCIIIFGVRRSGAIEHTMNYYGIRILTTSPGACPWVTTRRRCRRPSWSSPEGGSFPSWTLRPPRMGRPSFSCLPRLGGELFSSSSFPWEECASESSNNESDTNLRRRPFRVPVAFFLAFFAGTSYDAGVSIFVRRASAGSSGRGAGQSSCSTVFIQSC